MSVVFSRKMKREYKTIQAMIKIYCHGNHDTYTDLCDSCAELEDYALGRLINCKYKDKKPTCGKCNIHCYKPTKQEQIRIVMRYSGPRMMLYHPVLAVYHLLDEIFKRPEQKHKST